MDNTSAIDRRRMIREYTAEPVGPAEVHALLEAATQAPSPHNRQPWRFAIVTGPARMRLADAMGERLISDRVADGAPDDVARADAARSRLRVTTAPASILACLTMTGMDRYPDARRNDAERWMAGQAVAAAVQNMLLQAEALGLGACWMCAPLFCPDTARAVLLLPDDWEPQALIALGQTDGPRRERARLPGEAITVRRDR